MSDKSSKERKTPEEAARLSEARARVGEERFRPEAKEEEVSLGSDEIIKCLQENEVGDAKIAIARLKRLFRFDRQRRLWFRFNGNYYQKDTLGDYFKEANQALTSEYQKESNRQNRICTHRDSTKTEVQKAERLRDALNKRIKSLNTRRRMESVIALASTGTETLAITGDEWNADKWALMTQNKFINLKTGSDRPGRLGDYINKVAPVEWRGFHVEAEAWEGFLSDIFGDDQDLVQYVQKVLGGALVGTARQQEFYILHGEGRNGKSTLLEVLKKVLGPLVGPVQSEIITGFSGRSNPSAPNPEILDLQGKRLVWASETPKGSRLNIERVKLFTGADTLKGRYNYSNDLIEFTPTHTLLLLTNHKPRIGADEFALWQRVRLIPFKFKFVDDHERDPHDHFQKPRQADLLDHLLAEKSGILAWLVTGCLLWQEEGLEPPQEVKEATKEYKSSEDIVGRFVDACCHVGSGLRQQAGPLYEAFKTWWKVEFGEASRPIGNRNFAQNLSQKFPKENTRHTYYLGLGLKEEDRS